MMIFITVSALYLNFVFGSLGLARAIQGTVAALNLEPWTMMIAIVLMYTVLGMFMDSLAMIVLTVPFVVPIITNLGYSPVWFGIVIVIMTELAMVTPPIGMGCFVIQGLRRTGNIGEVFRGVLPFVVALYVLVLLITVFPELALWLPGRIG